MIILFTQKWFIKTKAMKLKLTCQHVKNFILINTIQLKCAEIDAICILRVETQVRNQGFTTLCYTECFNLNNTIVVYVLFSTFDGNIFTFLMKRKYPEYIWVCSESHWNFCV